jgi:hypothetical protein
MATWGYVRPEKQTVGERSRPPRLLPILLPSRWTTLVPPGQLWNVGPAHGPQRTLLDDVPTTTDQMLSEAGACPLRGLSDKLRKLTITLGKANFGTRTGTGISSRQDLRHCTRLISLWLLLICSVASSSICFATQIYKQKLSFYCRWSVQEIDA